MNREALPPIWVLSLERSKDRRLFMENQLKGLNLEFEIIKAVDGQALTEDDGCNPKKMVTLNLA